MRLPIRPVAVLARPGDEALCWTASHADSEDDLMMPDAVKECSMDKQFKLELCHQLSSWLGWAACAFASWEVICRSIASKQKDLVRHLNETMFQYAECQVGRLQPICINGCLGQVQDAASDIFSVGYLQKGRKKGQPTKQHCEANSRHSHIAEFNIQGRSVKEQLAEFVGDAHQRENVYLVLLDQRFFCQQDDAPSGPLQWRSKTVLLRLEMQMQTRMAVQLDLMPSAEELQVRGINLAGEEVAHLRLAKEDAFGLLRDGVAKAIGQHIDKLCMVLPDGTYASAEMDGKTMTEVFT